MSASRVAVIGAGVSGLTAAYLLRTTHTVTLYEADERLGGHAHTHDVTLSPAAEPVGIDSGFIVHNDRTYPLLQRLFRELKIETRPTEMTMGISCRGCGLEYSGGRGLAGIYAQRRRVADPRFQRMLVDIARFQRLARRLAGTSETLTYGEFLERHRFSRYFVEHYAIPVVSCVWSCGADTAMRYPASYLFAFLDNHGFLRLGDAPQWYTVVGGSRTYVERIAALLPDVRKSTAVSQVQRLDEGVLVTTTDGRRDAYDQVVLAVHGDDVLSLLADPTEPEKELFGAFRYTPNRAVLHRDDRRLPHTAGARIELELRPRGVRLTSGSPPGHVLDEPAPAPGRGNAGARDPQRRSQRRPRPGHRRDDLPPSGLHTGIGRRRSRSACSERRPDRLRRCLPGLGIPRGRVPLRVRRRPGHSGAAGGPHDPSSLATAGSSRRLSRASRSETRDRERGWCGRTRAGRRCGPTHQDPTLRHAFRYRTPQWLVDVDDPNAPFPRRLRWLAAIRGRDHFSADDGSLRDKLNRFVVDQQLGWTASRALMLTNAACLGYVFDPITVYFVYDAKGDPEGVLAEVHNTYGERHCYVLQPDEQGRSAVEKAFYVSPFFDVSGGYEIRTRLAPQRIQVSVTLRKSSEQEKSNEPGGVREPVFVATVDGRLLAASRRTAVAAIVRWPLAPHRVFALIRWQGFKLWLRRIPIQNRPSHEPPVGMR